MKRVGSNKVLVQLLKDFPGLGVRGELVKVAPGRMRNELHPFNGAAYVLKDMQLRIPRVVRAAQEEVQASTVIQESKTEAILSQKASKVEKTVQSLFGQTSSSTTVSSSKSDLTFLKFPSEGKSKAAANKGKPAKAISSQIELLALFNMLPPVLQWGKSNMSAVEESGKLSTPISLNDIAQHISKLVGANVPVSSLCIETIASAELPGDKIRTVGKSLAVFGAHHIDYCGEYTVTVKLDTVGSGTRKLVVGDGSRLRPIDVAVTPRSVAADDSSNQTASSTTVEPEEAAVPEPEPGFEWNNQLIEKFLKK